MSTAYPAEEHRCNVRFGPEAYSCSAAERIAVRSPRGEQRPSRDKLEPSGSAYVSLWRSRVRETDVMWANLFRAFQLGRLLRATRGRRVGLSNASSTVLAEMIVPAIIARTASKYFRIVPV